MFKLVLEKAEEPEIKLPTSTRSWKKQESFRKTSISALLTMLKPLTVWIKINWKILKEMGISDHLTCLLRKLYTGQEATVRTGHGTTDWFQIGKGVHQGCILSPCLFNSYAEYIMRNAGLEGAQAGIKIAGRNVNDLRYADDPTLMGYSKDVLIASSVQFSLSVMSDSLSELHELQHARPPCPSPTPGVHPNSCPSSQWCHPAISSSVIPFSSCPQSLPASESFPMSQLFAPCGQSIGVSALASVLPKNTQDWSALEWSGWISLQSKGLSRVFSKDSFNEH